MKSIVLTILAVCLLGAGSAAAQQAPAGQGAEPAPPLPDDGADRAAPMDEPPASIAPAETGRRMAPSGAQLQQLCEDQLRTDAAWRTRLRDQLTERLLADDADAESQLSKENLDWRARMKRTLAVEIHQEDADEMATNRKHVIMAYAALWILTALFIIYMYMRQMRLREEITRLEREIRDAAKQ